MKKLLVICLLLVLAVSFASAQETTWTNPYDSSTYLIPRSMISVVSNGMLYDAIDVLLTSPAELSDFEGVSVYTAYGNYQSFNFVPLGAPVTVPVQSVNPFTTNLLTGVFGNGDTSSGDVAFSLGYLMPVMGFQSGIVLGFEEFYTELLDDYPTNGGELNSEYSESTTYVNDDTNVDGVSGYTATSAYTYTDYATGNSFSIGSGVDLGFMGVSAYFNINDYTEYTGGTYSYTITPGTDTLDFNPTAAEQTVSKNIIYGYKEDGSAGAGLLNNNWTLALNGEFPLTIADYSMPVTASVQVNAGCDGSTSWGIPQNVTVVDSYVDTDGAGGTADDTSTLTYLIGVANLDYDTIAAEHIAAGTPVTASAEWADVTAIRDAVGNEAQNMAAIDDGFFTGLVKGRIDPKFELSDILSAKTRFQMGFGYYSNTDTTSGTKTISYSRADSAATNSTYSYSYTTTNPNVSSSFLMNFEVGGVLEAKTKDNTLVVSAGAFYAPDFTFGSTSNLNEVTTETATATDATSTLAQATNASGVTDVGLGAGNVQGTVTEVTTTSYTGKSTDNEFTHNFIIPVSAAVNLFDNKLTIVGGYNLFSSVSKKVVTTADSTITSVITSTTTDGTNVSPAASTSVSSSTTGSTTVDYTNTDWGGLMNFMVRWQPTGFVTLDFFGQSIMTALNFDIFGDGTNDPDGDATADGTLITYDGLNLNNFIDSLSMSITFHITE